LTIEAQAIIEAYVDKLLLGGYYRAGSRADRITYLARRLKNKLNHIVGIKANQWP